MFSARIRYIGIIVPMAVLSILVFVRRQAMEERFDGEEKKHSGFGKGFFGGFLAAFVLMG